MRISLIRRLTHPAVVIGILCLAPFAKLLPPNDRVIPVGDYVRYQVPVRDFARQELLAGRLPLWIPYIGLGTPVHAGQQGAFCYPLLMPLVLCFGANAGNKLALFSHLLLCFVGEYRLARSFKIGPPASAFAALVATQSGFITSHLCAGHVNLVLQYALLPWFFLSLKSFLADPAPRRAALLSTIVACLVFAGHPQVAYYGLLAGIFWWLLSIGFGAASCHRLRCVAWTSAAAVAAILVSAIQLLPSLELGRDGYPMGNRGSRGAAGHFALVGTDLFQFVLPTHKGHLFAGVPELSASSLYQERAGYLGILSPFLCLYSLTRRRSARWQCGAAVLAALSIVIALGNSTPLFGILGKVLPGLFMFRCPGRVFSVLGIFAALLAADGLEALAVGRRRASSRMIIALVAACWAVCNALGYALLSPAVSPIRYARYVEKYLLGDLIFLAAVIFCAGLFAALWRRFRLPRAAFYTAALFATSLDLWYFHVQYLQLEPRPDARIPSELLAARPPIRFVEDADTISWVHLHYCDFIHAAINCRRVTLGTNEGGVLPVSLERLYRTIEGNREAAVKLAACDYEYLTHSHEWRRRKGALPRVWLCRAVAAGVCDVPIDRVFAGQLSSAVDESAQIEIASEEPRRLALHVRASSPGKLVVADLFYPGWRCSVNGVETPIEKAFEVFRAISLDAGESIIHLSYEPQSFRYGAIASAVGLFLLGLLFCGKPRDRLLRPPRARSRHASLGVYAIALVALMPLELVAMNHLGNRQIVDSVMAPMSSKIVPASAPE